MKAFLSWYYDTWRGHASLAIFLLVALINRMYRIHIGTSELNTFELAFYIIGIMVYSWSSYLQHKNARTAAKLEQELDALEKSLDQINSILEEDVTGNGQTDEEIQREISEKYATYILDQQLRVIADYGNQKKLN